MSRLSDFNRRNIVVCLVYYFWEKFFLPKNLNIVQNYDEVAVVHNGDLGDLVIILSVLRILKSHTNKPIILYTKKENSVLRNIIPEYIEPKFQDLKGGKTSEQVLDLKRHRPYSRLVFITHRFNPSILHYILKLQNAEIHCYKHLFGAVNVLYGKYKKYERDTEIKSICRIFKYRFPDMPLLDYVPLEECYTGEVSKKSGFGIIHPFSRERSKWMKDTTIEKVLMANDYPYLLVGNGQSEEQYALKIIEELPDLLRKRVVNRVSQLNIEQLLNHIREAPAVHCTDSFVCHLAATFSDEVYLYVNSLKNQSFFPSSNNVRIIYEA